MSKERILVVEDSSEVREFLAHIVLPNEGYDVLTAADGAEGLILARDLQPDLIISDYQMPTMTGLEMLNTLKSEGIHIPMILITAEGSEELAVQAMRAGVYDYLIKPFDVDAILKAVRDVLNRHWARLIKERVPAHLMESNLKLQQRIHEMDLLVNIGKSVTAMLDIQQVLNHVVEAAVEVTGAEESSLMLIDPSTGEMYIRAARNFDERTVHTLRLPVTDSLAGQVVRSGQPIVLTAEDMIKIKTAYLVKDVAYIPLCVKEEVVGVLGVDNRTTARTFDSHEIQMLSVLADFAAVAIENARLYADTVQERDTLNALLRDTEDLIIVVDAEDRVLFCNPNARKVFGVSMTDFVGKPLSQVIDNAEVQALFSKHALVGRGRRSEVSLFGGEKTYNAQLTIIEGIGRAAVMQDITPLKEMDHKKNEFVMNVSHDLRSPLTAILGYLDLVGRTGPLNEQQEKFITHIQQNINSVTALLTELLELSRIEEGFDTDLEPVNIPDIVNSSVSGLSHQLEHMGHKLDMVFDPNLPPVFGNPLRLKQVATNLIGNAIKYTPRGGTIKVVAQRNEDLVVFQVLDSGIGIPAEEQPYVFDKFYRTKRAVSDFEGTGLGLAIVKSIVEQHNGRIWLNSRENVGTAFTVVLPINVLNKPNGEKP